MTQAKQASGEPDDLRARLERHHGEAFAWSLACCKGERDVAEDVLQTSYLKILDGRAQFEGRSTFRTWLFSVIRHTAADSWRAPWRRRRVALGEDTVAGRQDEAAPWRTLALEQALASLSRRQRQLLTLVYGHGLKLREAAEVMGVSQGTAATHLHRGKQALRKRLGNDG